MPETIDTKWCELREKACAAEIKAVRELTHLIARSQTEAFKTFKEELDRRLNVMLAAEAEKHGRMYLEKKEYEAEMKDLTTWKNNLQGKSITNSWIGMAALLVAILSVVVPLFIHR